MFLSIPPDANTLPSGEKATARKPCDCLRSVWLGLKTIGSAGPAVAGRADGTDLPAAVAPVVSDPVVAVPAVVAPVPPGHQELTRNQPASDTPATTTRAPTRPALTNRPEVGWRPGREGSAVGILASLKIPSVCNCASRRLSTAATSPADAKRSAGSLAWSLATSDSSHSGMLGLISRSGRGVSSHTRLRTASELLAPKGACPAHIAYSTLPRLNRSLRASTLSSRACSGDI